MTWRNAAACKDEPIQVLFGPADLQRDAAARLCARCPVLNECADQGKREAYGLWGGQPEGARGRPKLSAKAPAGHAPEDVPVVGCRCQECKGVREEQRRDRERERERMTAAEKAKRRDDAKTERRANNLLHHVAKAYGVTATDIRSRKQGGTVLEARNEAIVLLRGMGLSTPKIGELVGRDHSTVLYALKQAEEVAA